MDFVHNEFASFPTESTRLPIRPGPCPLPSEQRGGTVRQRLRKLFGGSHWNLEVLDGEMVIKWGFNGGLMGFYSDLMGFNGN